MSGCHRRFACWTLLEMQGTFSIHRAAVRRGFRGAKFVATFRFQWNNSAIPGFVPRWVNPGDLMFITLQPSDQKARFYKRVEGHPTLRGTCRAVRSRLARICDHK